VVQAQRLVGGPYVIKRKAAAIFLDEADAYAVAGHDVPGFVEQEIDDGGEIFPGGNASVYVFEGLGLRDGEALFVRLAACI